jgi:hypothetical protein
MGGNRFIYRSTNQVLIKEIPIINEGEYIKVALNGISVKRDIINYLCDVEGPLFASICSSAFLEDERIYSKYGQIIVSYDQEKYVFTNKNARTYANQALHVIMKDPVGEIIPVMEPPSESAQAVFHFITIIAAAYISLYFMILFDCLKNMK